MLTKIDLRKYKAILFDLDATLIPFDQAEMSREFFNCAKEYENEGGPKGFGEAFAYAFAETKKNRGKCINKEVFDRCFYEKLPVADFDSLMDTIFSTVFTNTKKVVR